MSAALGLLAQLTKEQRRLAFEHRGPINSWDDDVPKGWNLMKWKPIESAPKDGTPILLTDGHRVIAAWWGDLNAADSEFGTVAHEECWGWLISDGHNDPIWYRGHPSLTHWMPQPDAR